MPEELICDYIFSNILVFHLTFGINNVFYVFQDSIKDRDEKFQTAAFMDALWDRVKSDTYCHARANSSLPKNMCHPLPRPASAYDHLGQMFDHYGEPIASF